MPTGTTLPVSIAPEATVEDLKSKIQDAEGIPI